MNYTNTQSGIALYMAIIVAGITLLLAVAVANIAVRQLELSRVSEDSQHAFYIADGIRDCVLQYNERTDVFKADTTFYDGGTISCAGYEGTTSGRYTGNDDNGELNVSFSLEGESNGIPWKALADIVKTKTKIDGDGLPTDVTKGWKIETKISIKGRYRADSSRATERLVVHEKTIKEYE